MGRLDGKVAVITGAAGGIGREAALLFSEEGASVCVADVSAEAGEQTASECRDAFFQHVDVTGLGERRGDVPRDGGALRRHRHPLQQRGHHAGGRLERDSTPSPTRGIACWT